jgi:hypothetical protein
MKVPLCFSAASMKTEKMNAADSSASMKKPRTTDVLPPSNVSARSSPGKTQLTSPAAVIPASIWLTAMNAPLRQGRLPTRHIPNVMAGLNRPLVTRKKTQALTTSEKPTLKAA